MRNGRHLLLIGLPGSGKTTVGRQLAAALSLPFIDLDEVIMQDVGQTVPRFFESHDEAAFRDVESAALRKVIQLPSHVIATGGGAVLREENRLLLQESGCVFFLDRPVESIAKTLDLTTHPTLQGTTISEMAALRRPLYLSCADHVITDENVDDTTRHCAEFWRKNHEVSHH